MESGTKGAWLPFSVIYSAVLASRCRLLSIALPILTSCARPAVELAPRASGSLTVADVEFFAETALMVPVAGVQPRDLRDSFSAPRGADRTHGAIDILAPRGTPVVAAVQGQVARMSQNAAGGITAWLLDDERRYVFYYAHLSHYSDAITEGLRVPQGFVLGYVGTSGNAPPDTPHLHFQVLRLTPAQRDWWNGTPVDVLPFMKLAGRENP